MGVFPDLVKSSTTSIFAHSYLCLPPLPRDKLLQTGLLEQRLIVTWRARKLGPPETLIGGGENPHPRQLSVMVTAQVALPAASNSHTSEAEF